MDGQDWKAAHQAQVAKDRKTDKAVKELDIASLKLAALVVDDGIIQAGLLEAVLKELTSLLAARIGADKSPLPPCWNDVLKSDQSGGAEIIRELLAVNGLKPELRSGLLLAFKTQWAKEQRESVRDFGAIWKAISSDAESSGTSSLAGSILGMLSNRGFSEDEAARVLDMFRELVELEDLRNPTTSAKVTAERVCRLREFHGVTESEEWMKFFESLSLKRVTLLCSALRGRSTDQDLCGLLDERMLAELQQLAPLLQGFLEFVTTDVQETPDDNSESEWWATSPPPPDSGWHDKPLIGTRKQLACWVGSALRGKRVDEDTLATMHANSVWIFRVNRVTWQAYFRDERTFALGNAEKLKLPTGTQT